ncbi:hypothetical protein FOZ63_027857, partial [Perkinsus olseni]
AYGQVLRMDTAYSFIPRYGYALTGGLSVDNQPIWAQIDTGASALFFTWKEWYDASSYTWLPLAHGSAARKISKYNLCSLPEERTKRGRTQGELLFGGGDPTLYKAPLTYIPLRSQQEYLVTLGTLQVGTGHKSIGINQPALIDTGTQGLVIPPDHFDATLKAITDQASATANFTVTCDYIPALGACVIDCHHIVYLPPIELGLGASGNAPVLVSGLYYSRDTGGGFCTVATKRGQGSTWTLPHFILVGKYFEFQPSQQRVGIADLQRR